MEVAIMVEGQNGLNRSRWQRIARAVEDLGFAGRAILIWLAQRPAIAVDGEAT